MDNVNKGWKDGSVFKSTDFSFRGPQRMHGGSQPSVTPVPGCTVPSFGFLGHKVHMRCTDVNARKPSILRCNTNCYIILLIKNPEPDVGVITERSEEQNKPHPTSP